MILALAPALVLQQCLKSLRGVVARFEELLLAQQQMHLMKPTRAAGNLFLFPAGDGAAHGPASARQGGSCSTAVLQTGRGPVPSGMAVPISSLAWDTSTGCSADWQAACLHPRFCVTAPQQLKQLAAVPSAQCSDAGALLGAVLSHTHATLVSGMHQLGSGATVRLQHQQQALC